MLRGKELSLSLSGRPILQDINLDLRPGSVTAVLGPNGAGKTSLLRILSGEWKPDRGSVELGGRPLASIPIRELGQRRAYLHQESSLDFAFTVLEVVLLGRSPHMAGGERPRDYEVARQALLQVDLLDRQADHYTSLSGGEKQRVHLARVLAQITDPAAPEPRYLFLDEPTNNLDLSHQRTIFQVVRVLASQGVGVCMVLHDLNQAVQTADWIVILDKGRVALAGEPARIAEAPACERIFGVPLRRISVPGKRCPYLLFENI